MHGPLIKLTQNASAVPYSRQQSSTLLQIDVRHLQRLADNRHP
jgi:hypothetical protein